jgi:dolichyl-phosphate beta-glucosyltransferase
LAAAQGEEVLFADADGATPIAEEAKLRGILRRRTFVAVGSRLLHTPGTSVCRTLWRGLPGRAFAWLGRVLFGLPVRDTQCGFKMFRREVLAPLLDLCRESGYLFDLEILVWAFRLGYGIAEVPVVWREVPGSKVRLLRDGWAMLRGLFRLRRSLGRVPLSQRVLALAPASALSMPLRRDSAGSPSLESQER